MSAGALTVVVPTHDVAPWIDECLTSIRGQQGVELRIVVIDDHSTDGTLAIVERHAADDPRMTVLRAAATGGGPARNEGAARVDTRYLAFADGDDLVPPGAYAAMVSSLESTGSELAVGNFFKFAALRTWRPSLNWRAFDAPMPKIGLADDAPLIRNRACWNRVFRTDFWRREGIEFPDAVRSNDIAPMTTALVRARTLDVLPDYVYLYRERPGASSMTAVAHQVDGLLSYLEQELICAALVVAEAPDVHDEYAALVFDADGWTHLRRYVDGLADGEAVDSRVCALVGRLVDVIGAERLTPVRPSRRIVFELLAAGLGDRAATACRAAQRLFEAETATLDELHFWTAAVWQLAQAGRVSPGTRGSLIAGLVVEPLVRAARLATTAELEELVAALAPQIGVDVLDALADGTRADALRIARALAAGDTARVAEVSRLISGTAFVTDAVEFDGGLIRLRGTAELPAEAGAATRLPVVVRPLRPIGPAQNQAVVIGELRLGSVSDADAATRPWTIDIRRTAVAEGDWQPLVRLAVDELGPVDVFLTTSRRGPVVPESRWAELVVLPRKQAGDRLTVVSRGRPLRRAVRQIGRLARRLRPA